MTHAALSSPHRPVAQTEVEAEDGSVLQPGPRTTLQNIAPPQDRSKATPAQSPSHQETSVSQGEVVLSRSVWPDVLTCWLHNTTLHRCVISAASLCKEAESVFSVYLDTEADGAPVGSR